MKNLCKYFGIIFMVMIISLLVLACPTGNNDTVPAELQGTWEDEDISFIFTATTFTIIEEGEADLIAEGLTFTASSISAVIAIDIARKEEQLNNGDITQEEYDEYVAEAEEAVETLGTLYPSGYIFNGTITTGGDDDTLAVSTWGNEQYGGIAVFLNPEKNELFIGDITLQKQ
jgi:hypothetical protein